MENNEVKANWEQHEQNGVAMDGFMPFSGSATNKTPLGLNQWISSDKPMMDHFNEDNRVIDEAIRGINAAIRDINENACICPCRPAPAKIMGYEWDFSNPSTALKRLGDAQGLTATPGIGAVAGFSDFDKMPIYKDIRRCNLAVDGTVTAYEGDQAFSFDGSNGDVMVEIPVFYYKVENDEQAQKYRYFVSDQPADGFAPHPAFARPMGTVDRIYVGAYELALGSAGTVTYAVSRSGLMPRHTFSRAGARHMARNKGEGWCINDFAARMAITMLIIVEFANLNTRHTIAPGNSNASSSAVLATGRTDNIVGTGREAGADSAQVSFVWRGIENLWGNVVENIDGINRVGENVWISTNPADYADETIENYTQLSYTIPLSSGIGRRFGFDENEPWAALPNVVERRIENTFLSDDNALNTPATGWRVARVGGARNSGIGAGAFAWNLMSPVTLVGGGGRLLYLPQ